MAQERKPQVSRGPGRALRAVQFPYWEPTERYRGEYAELATLARMLKTTVDELIEERANDYIPWAELPPLRHERGPATKESDMANDDEMVVVSSGWDEVDKSIGSGGSWLKIGDGQVVEINVIGAPQHVRKTFKGEKPKDRVLLNVFVPDVGAKQWEIAGATYAELKEERAACKEPFGEALFAVKRSGSGPDTRYRFRYRRQLTPVEVAARSDASAASGSGPVPDPF